MTRDDPLHSLDRVSRNCGRVQVGLDRPSNARYDLQDTLVRHAADRERCIGEIEPAREQLPPDLRDQILESGTELIYDDLIVERESTVRVGLRVAVVILQVEDIDGEHLPGRIDTAVEVLTILFELFKLRLVDEDDLAGTGRKLLARRLKFASLGDSEAAQTLLVEYLLWDALLVDAITDPLRRVPHTDGRLCKHQEAAFQWAIDESAKAFCHADKPTSDTIFSCALVRFVEDAAKSVTHAINHRADSFTESSDCVFGPRALNTLLAACLILKSCPLVESA